jgi:leucyl aminopeptidase
MSLSLKLSISDLSSPSASTLVLIVDDTLDLGKAASTHFPSLQSLVKRVAAIEKFKGKAQSSITLLAPLDDKIERIIVLGIGPAAERGKLNWLNLGGGLLSKLPVGGDVDIILEDETFIASNIADFALGMQLKAYNFEQYKTKKKESETAEGLPSSVTLMVSDKNAVKKAWKQREPVAEGANLARTLVNEPPNILDPVEFASRASKLEKLGVEIEELDEKQLKKLGMRALLGVGQGSTKDSRVVIMRWFGSHDEKAQPIAFVGKGVTFDTGGISIKPAAGMEDMKGDMGGAACVVGLMHALASRKAKVNAIGIIGLVENMPDGNAVRPGDILTSMSGQTIEIINTDAEGRLVLADILHHINTEYKPKFIVDLATLTGAILVALGQEYAGMFSNNDELCERLSKVGEATGERVWRMPLCAAFDKMIDSKFADMKNTGGRFAGSSTAAHFLQRFIGETPWAHLDVAGTAMASATTDTNRSWGSGWGVRLLNQLVADYYED